MAKGAFEYALLKMKRSLPPGGMSALFTYYLERVAEHDISEDAGASMRTGMKVIQKYGCCQEIDWPYDISRFADRPPTLAYSNALIEKGSRYARVPHIASDMMRVLAAGDMFVVGISVFESFVSNAVDATGDVPLPDAKSERLLGGHAIGIVGYDLARQVFLFRNSWSTQWGDKGYGTLPMSYLSQRSLAEDFWRFTVVP
jgi:C1A family cysteine protease